MKNKFKSLMLLMTVIFSLTSTIMADSKSYKPPAETGYIYIVVKYRAQVARPLDTNISVNWGGYSRSSVISPPTFVLVNNIPEGFVIRLEHRKKDSMTVDVSTNGTILSVYQGNPPGQFNQKGWKSINW